jgi:hypothetical protein
MSLMREVINEPVTVVLSIDSARSRVMPQRIKWRGTVYAIRELGFVHAYRDGRTTIHVFSVHVGSLDMRLEISGESFQAVLKEVSDGLAD